MDVNDVSVGVMRDAGYANRVFSAEDSDQHHCDSVYAHTESEAYYASANKCSNELSKRKRRRKQRAQEVAKTGNHIEMTVTDSECEHGDRPVPREMMAPHERVQQLLDQPTKDLRPLFSQLSELQGPTDDKKIWRQLARWVKFEEIIEEGGNRWSKPHVATPSLHSLFELRNCIKSGTVILDMDTDNLQQMFQITVDKMIAAHQIEFMHGDDVQETLMRPRKHQYQRNAQHKTDGDGAGGDGGLHGVRSMADIGRLLSSANLKSMATHDQNGPKAPPSNTLGADLAQPKPGLLKTIGSASNLLSVNRQQSSSGCSSDADVSTQKKSRGNQHFFKKLPSNVEASNILIGELDYLTNQTSAFIRLHKPSVLDDLAEVPVPTRFVFILLGPKGNSKQFRDVGRAMATLLTDDVFHDVAYKARDAQDLLDGVDEFLDQVTVLPPGEWDPNIRIEPPKVLPTQTERKKTVGATAQGSNPNLLENGAATGGGAGGGGEDDPDRQIKQIEEEIGEGHGNDPALKRTGKLFGGLIQDVKRKLPWYGSDWRDAISIQCVASAFFMYFAILAPIVTFGGLLEEATGQRMAAMENLLSGALCGITYHLFAGQPLTIIGSTGPVLVFETIIYDLCGVFGINFLSFRLWINVWTSFILIIMVATDASALVSFITRFTEESFATLIALIFIYASIVKVFKIYGTEMHISEFHQVTDTNLSRSCFCMPQDNDTAKHFHEWWPSYIKKQRWTPEYINTRPWGLYDDSPEGNHSIVGVDYLKLPLDLCTKMHGKLDGESCYYMNDVFLMSVLLMIGTYYVASTLKGMRTSRFMPSYVRRLVCDFAVMIAIIIMVFVDKLMGVPTPKLNVPSQFRPTYHGRGWVISPFVNPIWTYFCALIPALLSTILIFMDQQITAVIVNRKENKLKKGCGYHLDLFVIAIQIAAVGFLGIPIYVAATVLSINHVNSLRIESESKAPGEAVSFVGVREQRVTGVITFVLIGCSVFFTNVLKLIPMPVLYGVFLFMGIGALNGIQLFDRFLLMFMPMKHQPDYMYLRHVPIKQVHLFTMFQVACLAVLWVIKSIKATSISFPVMLVVMVLIRKLMEYVFRPEYLQALDDEMPDFALRKKEELKKKKQQKMQQHGDNEGSDSENGHGLKPVATSAHLHVPMQSGNVMSIPLSSLQADKPHRSINMTDQCTTETHACAPGLTRRR